MLSPPPLKVPKCSPECSFESIDLKEHDLGGKEGCSEKGEVGKLPSSSTTWYCTGPSPNLRGAFFCLLLCIYSSSIYFGMRANYGFI